MMAELHPPELHGVGPIEAENIRLQYQSVALSFLVVIFIPTIQLPLFQSTLAQALSLALHCTRSTPSQIVRT